jgi:TP901 family phage tail tape measure protein
MAIARNVVVRVAADISDLQKSLKDAQKAMQNAGKELSKVGDTLTKSISIPIAAIGTGAVMAAADFEEGMSKVKAVSGATGEQMQELQGLALQMGKDTKYSAKEAASGIEELIKAGVGVEDILAGGLSGALSLAAAGEIELADAAEIASTALNAFKNDNLSVAKAADILAGAANASATDVMELKMGLSQASAVASAVGLSFEDTVTTLAEFAQNGLKGSDAGTSLKSMLLNLQPATKEQKKLFSELGLTTKDGTSAFYDANGKLKSMGEISDLLKSKLKNMTDAQRLSTLEVMFGTDAIRAANILYKEGADGIKNMKSEMSKVTAEKVAAEKMNNLKGSIEQLKGSLETAAITVGAIVIPKIKIMVDKITVLANKFAELDPELKENIIKWGLMAAALGPVLSTSGKLLTTGSSLIGTMSKLAKSITTTAKAAAAVETATAGASVGTAGLGASLGSLAVAAAPWVITGAAVAGTGYLIYKGMTEEAIPAVNLFADKYDYVVADISASNASLTGGYEETVTKISENTQKAVGAYIKLDDEATAALRSLFVNSTIVSDETSKTLIAKYDNMGTQIKLGIDKKYSETYEVMKTFFTNSSALTQEEEAKALNNLKKDNEMKRGAIVGYFEEINNIMKKASDEKRALTLEEQQSINSIQELMKQTAVKTLSDTELESKIILERMKSYSTRITAEQSAQIIQSANDTKDKAITAANEQYDKYIGTVIKMRDESKSITAEQADKLIAEATRQRDETINKADELRAGVVDKLKQMNPEVEEQVNIQTGKIRTAWDKLKDWWNGLIFPKKTMEVETINTTKNITQNVSTYDGITPSVQTGGDYSYDGITPHADGGIFTKPTLWGNHLIGEAGPEALVPLDRLGDFSGNSDRPIIIYLEGKKIYEGVDGYLGSKLVALGR